MGAEMRYFVLFQRHYLASLAGIHYFNRHLQSRMLPVRYRRPYQPASRYHLIEMEPSMSPKVARDASL